jgi:predicted DNA-binding transcriptional regulator YafY
MRSLDDRFDRVAEIERMLVRHPAGYTSGELARHFQRDPTTIYRDLAKLEKMGTGVVRNGRKWMLDHRRSLYDVRLTHDEMLALFLAARLLSRHSDEHNPHVVAALEKLADALRMRAPEIARHVDLAADSVRERRTRPEYVAALENIGRAWAEGRKVRLTYWSYSKGETTERIFAPYFIEPSSIGFACHVIGYDELRGEVRTLKIERVHDAALTDEHYTTPPSFQPLRLLANAWGIVWSDEGEVEVVLRFSSRAAQRVRESVWHHSQRIVDSPDGSCLFTVRVGGTLELKPWVRQWGSDVEVLAPERFRDEIAAEAQALAAIYALA